MSATIRALQFPRLDTSKARRRSKKAKIDSRDDDNLYSYVSYMGLATMAVETGVSGQQELFEARKKKLGLDSWAAKRSEASERGASESLLLTATAAGSLSV